MLYTDYKSAREFIQAKSLSLMVHEKKKYTKVGFPIQNFRVYDMYGSKFYEIRTNLFIHVMQDVLPEAMGKYPAKFGINN